MDESIFQPAIREAIPLRIAIAGPTGAGKTVAALRMARGMVDDWSKVFVIQAEPRANVLGYANDSKHHIGQFMFWQMEPPCTPERLVRAMKNAVNSGAGAVVVDTFSHIWAGRGGIRETHDKMDGNPWTNWDKVNPRWFMVIDYITYECPVHVILVLRSKLKSVQEQDESTGRAKVRLIGMEPILRPETEYEFSAWFNLDRETYRANVVTMRGNMLGDEFNPALDTLELTEQTGKQLATWASGGVPWLPGLPYGLITETLEPAPGKPEGNQPPPEGNTVKKLSHGDFWKVVFAWATKKRLTTSEARKEALILLDKKNQDCGAVIAQIYDAWQMEAGDIPAQIMPYILPGHGMVTVPLQKRTRREVDENEPAPPPGDPAPQGE